MDTFTSLFAGFTIFSVLGNLADTLEVDITLVAKAGKILGVGVRDSDFLLRNIV